MTPISSRWSIRTNAIYPDDQNPISGKYVAGLYSRATYLKVMMTPEAGERRLTTDRETIRQWAEEHDVVPVQTTGGETTVEDSNPYSLRTETELTETMETLSWDQFFQQVEENDLVIVLDEGSADPPLEVVDRAQAVSRAPQVASEVEERLLAGETVTSELTETTVVERTIVEHATIESEIVDTEELDSRVVDVALRSREISGCDVIDRSFLDEVDRSRFEDVNRLTEGLQEDLPQPVSVEVDVEEDWAVTRELLERVTIESRITDVDVTETDDVESETLESSIEIEGIQQALLESDIVEPEANAEEVIQSDTIESEFHADDVVRTYLNQRRIVEDEVTERRVVRGELTESEVHQAETRESTTIETAFVVGDTLDAGGSPVGVTEHETEIAESGTEHGEDVRTELTEDDEGKPVVDTQGESIGTVEEVQGGKAYIDPEPGLVDRIKTKLGWGSADEEEYIIDSKKIDRVTDDEVELSLPK